MANCKGTHKNHDKTYVVGTQSEQIEVGFIYHACNKQSVSHLVV